MRDESKLIGGLLAGVGMMYLLDPDRGSRRRALVRDQAARATHKLSDGLDATARDLRNRAKGTAAELRSRLRREDVDDVILHERVRSALGRVVSHPSAIDVSVSGDVVTLSGEILESELSDALDAMRRVGGVSEVVNELTPYSDPDGVPSLQGGSPREARAELAQENWAPSVRVLAGALGGVMLYEGLRREAPIRPVLATVGAALLARAATNLSAARLTGVGAGRRAITVHKVINVDALIDRVWALWSNFESFPRFMSHLKDVRRTGEGRSHWVAVGPAGTTIEWNAVTTASVPKELVAWKSVEGSEVENEGRVRFRPNPDGTTQIDVQISYNPPAGALGHAVATLWGDDPKRAMDEDLVRLKSLLEEGKTSTPEGAVGR